MSQGFTSAAAACALLLAAVAAAVSDVEDATVTALAQEYYARMSVMQRPPALVVPLSTEAALSATHDPLVVHIGSTPPSMEPLGSSS
eukprot:gene14619-17093_t